MNGETGLVIYTDSLSSILALQNPINSSCMFLCFKIHELIQNLKTKCTVKIQFIPSHKSIKGNDIADEAAKEGHNNNVTLGSPLTMEDYSKMCKEKIWDSWKERYSNDIMVFGKGIFFYSNKAKPEHWPWSNHKSRIVETAITKLRIGHVGLRSHLFRINKSDTELCDCGQIETVDHYLLYCPLYQTQRRELSENLKTLSVPMTRKNLLGGGNFEAPRQFNVQSHFTSFLLSTGKIGQL